MDPPAARKQAQTQQRQGTDSVGFPSPTVDYATVNPKFVDDCTRMNFAIQQSLPEAVRRIVRDHWEKCLLGSEFHQAFIVSPRLALSHLFVSFHFGHLRVVVNVNHNFEDLLPSRHLPLVLFLFSPSTQPSLHPLKICLMLSLPVGLGTPSRTMRESLVFTGRLLLCSH